MKVLSCSVFERNRKVIVVSTVRLPSGIHQDADPIVVIAKEEAAALGHAIKHALHANREGVPPKEAIVEFEKKLFRAAQVRSWSALENLAKHIGVEQVGGKYELRAGTQAQDGGLEYQNASVLEGEISDLQLGTEVNNLLNKMHRSS
jgi:hypothetical protein